MRSSRTRQHSWISIRDRICGRVRPYTLLKEQHLQTAREDRSGERHARHRYYAGCNRLNVVSTTVYRLCRA